MPKPLSRLCSHTNDALYVRDVNVVEDLVGKVTFTQMMWFQIMGEMPSDMQTTVLDAVLVTLMEHGFTPSAITSRMVGHSSPEAMQAGVAAGLLAVGSRFVGTTENAAELLLKVSEAPEGLEAAARAEIKRMRANRLPLPGFGHHLHKPDDPRTPKLFEVAREAGVKGNYINALETLSKIVDEEVGKHLTINATGAIGAVLLEIGVSVSIMRGFSIISRCAGLVGHIKEEEENPTVRYMWEMIEDNIPYEGNAPTRHG